MRAEDIHRSAERSDPVTQPDEAAGFRPGTGAADPVVPDLDDALVSRNVEPYPRTGGVRVLDDVGQRLRTDEVQAGLDGRRQPPARYVDLDRDGKPVSEGADGRCQAMLGEDRGMQARGKRAQVLEPLPGVFQGLADEFPGPLRSGLPALLSQLQADQGGDEALLGTVVQVPGDALTRRVGCGHQACPRRYERPFRTLAVGDVAHIAGERRLSGQASAGDGQLSWKQAAVGTHGRQFDPAVQDALLTGLQVPCKALPVCLAQPRRHDLLREVAADHFLGPVAEGPLERAVYVGHPGVLVNADDSIESTLENGALPRLAGGEDRRPRLGDLVFPVGLAAQFRLGSPLSLGCDQLQARDDGTAQLREDRQEERLLSGQVPAAGDDQGDLLAGKRRGDGERPAGRKAFHVEPGDPGQLSQHSADVLGSPLVILPRPAWVPGYGAMRSGDRRDGGGDQAHGLSRRRRLGEDQRQAEHGVE